MGANARMQMSLALLIILGLMFALVHSAVFIDKVECDYDGAICVNATCYSALSRARVSKLTFGCYYPAAVRSPMALIRFAQRNASGQLATPLIEVEENVCKIMSSTTRNQLIERIFQNFGVRSNAVHCPLVGNVTVYKMPLNLIGFDNFMPRSRYLGQLQIRKADSKRPYYDLRVHFTLRSAAAAAKARRISTKIKHEN